MRDKVTNLFQQRPHFLPTSFKEENEEPLFLIDLSPLPRVVVVSALLVIHHFKPSQIKGKNHVD